MPRSDRSRSSQSSSTRAPEKKIGPFAGGIGVAIWINEVRTDRGPRKMRSVSISPRRYLDPESGQWRDSTSFRPGDLPALLFALGKAQDYMFTHPLDGEQAQDNDEIPY